jgi:hypothetical protein
MKTSKRADTAAERGFRALLDRHEEEMQQHLDEREREHRRRLDEAAQRQQQEQADLYAQQRIAEEQASQTIAPQFLDYIRGGSLEEIDAAIDQAKQKTAEIAAEVRAHQTPDRDPAIGRFESQQVDCENLSLEDYARMRPQLHIGSAEAGMWS